MPTKKISEQVSYTHRISGIESILTHQRNMNKYIQVTTSIDSEDAARQILQALLEPHLAACGHISGPITSSYWWKDKIEHAKEWNIAIKTRADLFVEIESMIKSKHKYEIPEILIFSIEPSEAYGQWMEGELKK